ncbi:uncharacterized protein MYCFIDRAFT_33275 [Pseudocercospora fijiensis CIRAD86]|uniref:Methyltransferase domain-containing protein n=1 Tax=Pseudocercospora fijiensis (strain CIRAD86) TaxID=383855 RepID=M2ZFX6_PSEFD|nr:uncharacterized protein MYCFIDRAFT_33275 [Pseudocercospora fijiensis CIRAD86]EME78054.1 hypothetical protein MYCFIDRAFT_33275 [Pseudocercospora fijiensis CIRAD86]
MEQSVFAIEATPESQILTSIEVHNDVGQKYEKAYAHDEAHARSLQWLIANLSPGSKVYDVGSGTGRPTASRLVEAGMEVTGIENSPVMLGIAREEVPAAKFLEADLRTWEPHPSDDAADCVVAYFSLIADVTQDDIRGFFIRVYRWLKPGGLFVFGTVPLAGNLVPCRWLGRNKIASGLDTHDNLNSINAAGFSVEKHENERFTPNGVEAGLCGEEDVHPEEHLFIYARRPT